MVGLRHHGRRRDFWSLISYSYSYSMGWPNAFDRSIRVSRLAEYLFSFNVCIFEDEFEDE
jgi:hypothetical protein